MAESDTPPKAGYRSTEFWLAAFVAVCGVAHDILVAAVGHTTVASDVTGLWSGSAPGWTGLAAATVSVVAYALARARVKSG